MKLTRLALPLLLLSLVAVQCSPAAEMNSTTDQSTAEQQAEQRLREHIEAIDLLRESDIARLPQLDIAGYFAFAVVPRATGSAGEVTYMVNDEEILTSGQPDHFDQIMGQVLADGPPPEVEAFAPLFLKMKAIRRGQLLEAADGHPLLEPGQLPPERFEAPSRRETAQGVNYRFWTFDTDRYYPVFWDVWVSPDGTTTYTAEELTGDDG